MTKGSDSREFFEIFKQTEKTEDIQKKGGYAPGCSPADAKSIHSGN